MRYYKYSFLLIVIHLFLSCSKMETNRLENKKLADAKMNALMNLLDGSEDFTTILSIKYKLDTDVVRSIIDECLFEDSSIEIVSILEAETIEQIENKKSNFVSKSIKDRIELLSLEHGVEPPLIASLLIDYQIWSESQNDEAY